MNCNLQSILLDRAKASSDSWSQLQSDESAHNDFSISISTFIGRRMK